MKRRMARRWVWVLLALFVGPARAQSPIGVQRYSHITLPVRELATSLPFYQNSLGLKIIAVPSVIASSQAWFDIGGGQQLRLVEGRAASSGLRVSLVVGSLKQTEQQFRQRNVAATRQASASGKPLLQVTDPDGYQIEFSEGKAEGPGFLSSAGKWLWKNITSVE